MSDLNFFANFAKSLALFAVESFTAKGRQEVAKETHQAGISI
jgi:hypothetical protein